MNQIPTKNKCDVCPRHVPDYTMYIHGNASEFKICQACQTKLTTLHYTIDRQKKCLIPPANRPKRVYKKKEKPKHEGWFKRGNLTVLTKDVRSKLKEKYGKGKFNPALKEQKAKTSKKTDTWLGWDSYDFKDEDLSTLIG